MSCRFKNIVFILRSGLSRRLVKTRIVPRHHPAAAENSHPAYGVPQLERVLRPISPAQRLCLPGQSVFLHIDFLACLARQVSSQQKDGFPAFAHSRLRHDALKARQFGRLFAMAQHLPRILHGRVIGVTGVFRHAAACEAGWTCLYSGRSKYAG